MNSNDIYSILSSKPHNEHHLKRYINFMNWCKNNTSKEAYIENHHICPKSTELFPEYKDTNWNLVPLTIKQHIIAHIMLWKAYGGKSVIPLNYMLNIQNSATGYNNRKIPTCIQIRYATKAREEFVNWRKGKSTYKDSEGNKFFLATNDPIIQELNLVGNNSGIVMSEESRQSMRDAKYPNKTITLYFLDNEISVKLFSEEFSNYINQGWSINKTDDDYDYRKNNGNKLLAKFWTGRSRYATKDGVYHGAYLHSDPIIQELELIQYRTQAQIDQNTSRTYLAAEARTGTNLYTNGIDEIFSNSPPDDSWYLGRKPRSEEWESKRINNMRERVVGSKTYTNGITNIFVKSGDIIPEGFYLGMKQKERNHYYTNGDKSEVLTFFGRHEVPIGYIKVIEPEARKILKHIELVNYKIENLDQAKEFVKLCMISDFSVNPNFNKYIKLHEDKLKIVSGLFDLKHTDLLKCIHNELQPIKCKFCGKNCPNLSNTFCSKSCRSKMNKL